MLKQYLNQLRGADEQTVRIFRQYYQETEGYIAELEMALEAKEAYWKERFDIARCIIRIYRISMKNIKIPMGFKF